MRKMFGKEIIREERKDNVKGVDFMKKIIAVAAFVLAVVFSNSSYAESIFELNHDLWLQGMRDINTEVNDSVKVIAFNFYTPDESNLNYFGDAVANGGTYIHYPTMNYGRDIIRIWDSNGVEYPKQFPIVVKNVTKHTTIYVNVDGDIDSDESVRDYSRRMTGIDYIFGSFSLTPQGAIADTWMKSEGALTDRVLDQLKKYGFNGKFDYDAIMNGIVDSGQTQVPNPNTGSQDSTGNNNNQQTETPKAQSTLRFTTESKPFIKGTSPKTVDPKGVLTRAQASAMLARLTEGFTVSDSDINSVVVKFSDIKKTDWFVKEVAFLNKHGVYDDVFYGSFSPSAPISRGEFAMLLQKYVSSVDGTNYAPVEEGSSLKMNEALGKAKAAGWLSGYSDGTIKPHNFLNRAEAVTIFCRMAGISTSSPMGEVDSEKMFNDVKPGDWFYNAIVNGAKLYK